MNGRYIPNTFDALVSWLGVAPDPIDWDEIRRRAMLIGNQMVRVRTRIEGQDWCRVPEPRDLTGGTLLALQREYDK